MRIIEYLEQKSSTIDAKLSIPNPAIAIARAGGLIHNT